MSKAGEVRLANAVFDQAQGLPSAASAHGL